MSSNEFVFTFKHLKHIVHMLSNISMKWSSGMNKLQGMSSHICQFFGKITLHKRINYCTLQCCSTEHIKLYYAYNFFYIQDLEQARCCFCSPSRQTKIRAGTYTLWLLPEGLPRLVGGGSGMSRHGSCKVPQNFLFDLEKIARIRVNYYININHFIAQNS